MLFFTLSACSKKSNNTSSLIGSNAPHAAVYQPTTGCTNCPQNSFLFAEGIGNSGLGLTEFEFGLSFYSASNNPTTNTPTISTGAPVLTTGYFKVYKDNASLCPLPVGRYQVETLQAGQFDALKNFVNTKIIAIEPTTQTKITINLSKFGLSPLNPGVTSNVDQTIYNNGFNAQMYILNVEVPNRTPCTPLHPNNTPFQVGTP